MDNRKRSNSKDREHFSLDRNSYIEAPQYLLKTAEIFPFDMDTKYLYDSKDLIDSTTDNYVPHTDRVLRPELVSTFYKQVKADVKKQVPGLIKRSDFVTTKDLQEIEDMKDVLEVA